MIETQRSRCGCKSMSGGACAAVNHRMHPRTLRANERDNVAVVVNEGGLPAGSRFPGGLVLAETIPEAHKVALADLAKGDAIVRYGVTIGYANRAIAWGSWVHEGLVTPPDAPPLANCPLASATPKPLAPLEGCTFEGYRNRDGSAGTKNILGITTTVQCVAATVEYAVRRIKAEVLPRYPHVDDVVAITHPYGCGVAIDAPGAAIPIRTLRNLSLHPNFGGELLVVSLGCEKLPPARLMPASVLAVLEEEPGIMALQDAHDGFGEMVATIVALAEKRLERLDRRRRVTCAASELVVGLQCGGSDAMSGVTANPAVGFAADLLVRAGATVMFSEVTEVRDAAHLLTARAATPEIARDFVREMAWYDEYLRRGGADRSANPTPGNEKGGLANIVEKAMGSIAKAGTTALMGVAGPGERVTREGSCVCGHAGQRLYLRHSAIGRGNEHAYLYHGARNAVWAGDDAGDQSGFEQRARAPLARSDRRGRGKHCDWGGHRGRGWAGDFFFGFGGGQWAQKDLGRPLGVAQRFCVVQSGGGDVKTA